MRLSDRMMVRLARLRSGRGTLIWQPEPPRVGDAATAQRLADGILLFDGRLVETRQSSPWDIPPPDRAWRDALHGHDWLDHAMATDDAQLWDHLSSWVWDWLDRFGQGDGPGWKSELVARRLTRLIGYSMRLLRGQTAERNHKLFQAIAMHTRLLAWRWRDTPAGHPRIEAIAGLVYAHLSLEGFDKRLTTTIADLGRSAEQTIQPDGGIASRNPEELGRCLALLHWSAGIVRDAGHESDPRHVAALRRGVPILDRLRQPGGRLARFHGGRSGADLNPIEMPPWPSETTSTSTAMGYLRLDSGATTLLLDGAAAPTGAAETSAHASALAFELSHDGLPVIGNCGSGVGFGRKAARSARRGPSHSTVELGARCPGVMVKSKQTEDSPRLQQTGSVKARLSEDSAGHWALCESGLYESAFGLIVERRLHLSHDGLSLTGEDTALATRSKTREQFNAAFPNTDEGCPMAVRFHLHPDVTAVMALSGSTAALTLSNRTRWLLRADAETLTLEPGHYFDETRLTPRATLQIVARTRVLEYWGRITWSLERLDGDKQP